MVFGRIDINKVSSAQQMSQCNRFVLFLSRIIVTVTDTLSFDQKLDSRAEEKYSGSFLLFDLLLLNWSKNDIYDSSSTCAFYFQ